ncbi:MAG TPA: patatin-like protein [Haliangium sp.]|nr:patatin-like protein [Haliangium sp.]
MTDSRSFSRMDPSEPKLDVSQEVRFAVVMYGGVSLAIYINGVAQELLRLVQATAPAEKGDGTARPLAPPETPGQPDDTMWTYRKLAYLLGDDELRTAYRAQLEGGPVSPEEDALEAAMRNPERTLRTRFVIDILSGTSAGGINAVFLAKALAGNRDMNALKQLWIAEGDIALLLNDKDSLAGLGLELKPPPQSLLNSRRMYVKLLEALDAVDGKQRGADACESPCVEELDLFVTATDLAGAPLPLGLSDGVVYERRHRNVFQFKYAADTPQNDFASDNNPFLAFASRCTSAFPFAFEPMCLRDIDEVLERNAIYGGRPECRSDSPRWKQFFKEVPDPRTGRPGVDFTRRAFADGGYLDNKPFSYATETMLRRHADLMVDRKLIYIEPNPAHPEDERLEVNRPDALANIKAAVLDLPTYETIREDLQRVLDRNRLLERVNRLIQDIEKDIEHHDQPRSPSPASLAFSVNVTDLGGQVVAEQPTPGYQSRPTLAPGQWNHMGLAEMIATYSPYYLPYRRLRIAAVTDDLAALMARHAGFDDQSDYLLAIRSLMRAWRRRTYKDNPKQEGDKTANRYLTDFDFQYRLRRLMFLRQKLAELLRLVAAAMREEMLPGEDGRLEQDPLAEIKRCLRLDESPGNLAELYEIVTFFKQQINMLYMDLRKGERELRKRPGADQPANANANDHIVARHVRGLSILPHHLEYILDGKRPEGRGGKAIEDQMVDVGGRDVAGCEARAERVLGSPDAIGLSRDLPEQLDELARVMREHLRGIMSPSKERAARLLDPEKPLPHDVPGKLEGREDHPLVRGVRGYLWRYFDRFEDYDQIRFPILYETDVGESDVVEVIRISPEDATSLINERAESRKGAAQQPRRKLAGTKLRNFGAFLKPAWRENDILWGRLDGAERLITTLLPDPRDARIRTALIDEAHMIILAEALPEVHQTMADIRTRVQKGEELEHVLEQALEKHRKRQASEAVARGQGGRAPEGREPDERAAQAPGHPGVDRRALLAYMRTEYAFSSKLDNKDVLRLVSRSAQVAGQMFESIAKQHQIDSRGVAWIARLGQLVWALIEVSSADGIWSLVWRRWLTFLYVFEVLLTLGAWLLGYIATRNFGLVALGITLALHVLILVFGDLMADRKKWRRIAVWLLVATVLVLAGVGLHRIIHVGIDQAVDEMVDDLPARRPGSTPATAPAASSAATPETTPTSPPRP